MQKPDETGTVSKADRQKAFGFADGVVKPGTVGHFEIPVARLPAGTWTTMPAVIMHGSHPGPCIWLSSSIHGDELNGIEIIRKVLASVQPRKLAGTVIAVPIVNVFGVTNGSRYLPDRRDLNRSFPGAAHGSLAGRLARLFFDEIVSRCTIGIDFHTGSGGRENLPQIRCDADNADAYRLASTFGAPIVIHANLRDGSLRSAAAAQGKLVLLYEAGEALRFDEEAIDFGVAGSLRVMRSMAMIDHAPEYVGKAPPVSRRTRWVRAGRSGFCHLDVGRGQKVERNAVIAHITDATGRRTFPVRTRSAGIIIGRLMTGTVHRGDAVANIAEIDA
ncbi:MAG: succinylglutamate desuccinylase/aspartoacylase family protein [Gammaproteobacteria bacterium]|nr:succinylglutamate desuccinylase/aspartoacylase family protein [Gammaproteobacteria bacterium]